MKFTLGTAGNYYTKEEFHEKFEQYGFTLNKCCSHLDGDRFIMEDLNAHIEISSLEELLAFTNKVGDIIIQNGNHIIIYDDYVE